MDLVIDPLALAGLAGFAALTGWALGCAQSSAAPKGGSRSQRADPSGNPDGEAPAPADAGAPAEARTGLCHQLALEERRAIFDQPVALAELHDQVCSIRRDEHILGGALFEAGWPVMPDGGEGPACRYLGRSGLPTCPRPIGGGCLESTPFSVAAQDRQPANCAPMISL